MVGEKVSDGWVGRGVVVKMPSIVRESDPKRLTVAIEGGGGITKAVGKK